MIRLRSTVVWIGALTTMSALSGCAPLGIGQPGGQAIFRGQRAHRCAEIRQQTLMTAYLGHLHQKFEFHEAAFRQLDIQRSCGGLMFRHVSPHLHCVTDQHSLLTLPRPHIMHNIRPSQARRLGAEERSRPSVAQMLPDPVTFPLI